MHDERRQWQGKNKKGARGIYKHVRSTEESELTGRDYRRETYVRYEHKGTEEIRTQERGN
jgi:hypothetical protein